MILIIYGTTVGHTMVWLKRKVQAALGQPMCPNNYHFFYRLSPVFVNFA